jgi:hypothetical protein
MKDGRYMILLELSLTDFKKKVESKASQKERRTVIIKCSCRESLSN